MRHRILLVPACLAVIASAGCSVPWATQPKPDHVIVSESPPPDDDRKASEARARDFVLATAEDGTLHRLRDAIARVYGDWEKGSDRAYVVTRLDGGEATPDNGRIIANAFAARHTSDTGDGRVMVYDHDGTLLRAGRF